VVGTSVNETEHLVAVGIGVIAGVVVTILGVAVVEETLVGVNVAAGGAVDVAEDMPVGVPVGCAAVGVAGTRVVVVVGNDVGEGGVLVRVPVGAGGDAVGMGVAVGMAGVGVAHTTCSSRTVRV
jgi:hypothetical protein